MEQLLGWGRSTICFQTAARERLSAQLANTEKALINILRESKLTLMLSLRERDAILTAKDQQIHCLCQALACPPTLLGHIFLEEAFQSRLETRCCKAFDEVRLKTVSRDGPPSQRNPALVR